MLLSKYVDSTLARLRVERRLRSEAERTVSAQAERHMRQQMGVIATAAGLLFHFASLWTDDFVVREPLAHSILALAHLGLLAATALAAYLYRRAPRLFIPWVVGGVLVNGAIYALIGYVTCVAQRAVATEPLLGFLALSVISVIICPTTGRGAAGMAVGFNLASGAMVYLGTHDAGTTVRWGSLELFVTMGALLVQRYITVQTTLAARAGLDLMLKIAPAPVVAHAMLKNEPLETAFKPQVRPCSCIAVSWVDYDGLTYRLGDAPLAALLDAYYDLVDRQLEAAVTDGFFYCDVMVGDMFIVIFDPPDQPGARSVAEAFAFARRFLDARRAAEAETLRRAHIDIGIASGEALIGIMGPAQHRKTTGLGELPGRAARLCGAALLLRRTRGTADRIVLDAASARRVDAAVVEFSVPSNRRIKDFDDPTLHFWERAG